MTDASDRASRQRLSLRMLAGLLIGAALGSASRGLFGDAPALARFVAMVTEPIGQIFLRLLFMLVIPLVVSGLAVGVAGLGDVRRLGRIGLTTLAITFVLSSIAVLLGVALVNVFQPGAGLAPAARERLLAQATALPATGGVVTRADGVAFLVHLVPANVVRAMVDGDMLAVMMFALFLGIGIALTRSDAARQFEDALQGVFDVVMQLLDLVIRTAPVAVACLLFTMTSRLGIDVLRQLGAYVGVVGLGLAVQQFGVYSIAVATFGRMSPLRFFRAIRAAMLTAFSTASSNATLPTALSVAERDLGLPSPVSRFVLTVGAVGNQNGTALFEGVTVLFLAQLYAVDLTLAQQVTVVGICILGGIGTAGVPAGSIPVVAMILAMVGVPPEGIGMILGVDRLLDMCRTTLNVTGDLVIAVAVSASERGRAA
jgi:dicarboxylate/amino acid:cation (Na+ or H+) symporter, DAACS family